MNEREENEGKARRKEGARLPIVCAETLLSPSYSLFSLFSPFFSFFSSLSFPLFIPLSPSLRIVYLHLFFTSVNIFSPFPITENYFPPASKNSPPCPLTGIIFHPFPKFEISNPFCTIRRLSLTILFHSNFRYNTRNF